MSDLSETGMKWIDAEPGDRGLDIRPSFNLGIDVPKEEHDIVITLETLKMSAANEKALEKLNAGLDDKVGPEVVLASDEGDKSFEFLEEDEEFQRKVAEGGSNPSAGVDQWARNRLNRFRACMGIDATTPFEDLPTRECTTLLCKFYERVTKLSGELYPTYTLMGLYRAFNRMLRRRQEQRIQETGVIETPFNIRSSAMYKSVGVACVLCMERSRNAGANKPRKKAEVVSLSNEAFMLAHDCMQITHPRGLQWRTFYFLEFRFSIRGGEELYKVLKMNFSFGTENGYKYVRYDERLSKIHKVDLNRYQDEHFRPPVTLFDPDVVRTLEAMILHLPVTAIYIFQQCIDGPRKLAWFSTLRTGERTLCNMMKVLHQTCGLDHEGIMNKSGRTTAVTRMKMAGVPDAVGQRITGHKSAGAYARYDRSMEAHVQAAQNCIGDGGNYEKHLQTETRKFKETVIDGYDVTSAAKKSKTEVSDVEMKPAESINVKAEITEKPEKSVISEKTIQLKKPETSKSKIDEMQVGTLKEKLIEWDTWADQFNWHDFEAKVMEGRTLNVNPLTAVFGHIKTMSSCHVTINIQNLKSG